MTGTPSKVDILKSCIDLGRGDYHNNLYDRTLSILAENGSKTIIQEIQNINDELNFIELDELKGHFDSRVNTDYIDSSFLDGSKTYRTTGNYIINAKFDNDNARNNYIEIFYQNDNDEDGDIDSFIRLSKIKIDNGKTFISESLTDPDKGFYINDDSYFVLPDGTEILMNTSSGLLSGIKLKDEDKLISYGKSVLDDSSITDSTQIFTVEEDYDHYAYLKGLNGELDFNTGASKFLLAHDLDTNNAEWSMEKGKIYYDLDSNAEETRLDLSDPSKYLRTEGTANSKDNLREQSLKLAKELNEDSDQLTEAFGIVLEYGSADEVLDFYYENYRGIHKSISSLRYAVNSDNTETWTSQLENIEKLIQTEKNKLMQQNAAGQSTGVIYSQDEYDALDADEKVNFNELLENIIKSIGVSSGSGSVLKDSVRDILSKIFYGDDPAFELNEDNVTSLNNAFIYLTGDGEGNIAEKGIFTQLKEQIQIINELEKVKSMTEHGDVVTGQMLKNGIGDGTAIVGLNSILGNLADAGFEHEIPEGPLDLETIENLLEYTYKEYKFQFSDSKDEAEELLKAYREELETQINLLDPKKDRVYISKLTQMSKALKLDTEINTNQSREERIQKRKNDFISLCKNGTYDEIREFTKENYLSIESNFTKSELEELKDEVSQRGDIDTSKKNELMSIIDDRIARLRTNSSKENPPVDDIFIDDPDNPTYTVETFLDKTFLDESNGTFNLDDISSFYSDNYRGVEKYIRANYEIETINNIIADLLSQIQSLEANRDPITGELSETDSKKLNFLTVMHSRFLRML